MLDPYQQLQLPQNPTDDEVRCAYLQAVRKNPPEQDAARFQAVQQAYATLKTQRSRLKHQLFCAEPVTPSELLSHVASTTSDKSLRPTLKQLQATLYHGIKP